MVCQRFFVTAGGTLIIAVCALLAGCSKQEGQLLERLPSDYTGIAFTNAIAEDDSLNNPFVFDYIYNGGGVAIGDVNNDGLSDVYFTGNMVSNRLYLNRGDLQFVDVTEAARLRTDRWSTGAALVDINQDGWLDVYVSVAGKAPRERMANLLFVNQGPGPDGVPTFEEAAEAYGIADTGYSTQATFFDHDRDGDLDLYVLTNAIESSNRNRIRPKRNDGSASSTDRLYRNNGDGTFTDVSEEAGILIEGYGLGVVVSDINQDGWPDVYVANDFLTNDILYVNNQDGTFTDKSSQYLKHQTYNGMGTDVADFNNDGLVDIVVLDMLPRDNRRRKLMLTEPGYDRFYMSLNLGYQAQFVRNTLQLNNGPGPDGHPTFSEIGQLAGIDDTDWSWGALFGDLDNDGLKDLLVTNGYRRDVTNLDFVVYNQTHNFFGTQQAQHERVWNALRELEEVKLSNHVFKNTGNLRFEDATKTWGLEAPSYSNGVAYGDLDNDGDLDVVVNNIDEEAFVFENHATEQSTNGFLRVALRGPDGNRAGYGAKVLLTAGGWRQYYDHSPYRGYLSTVENIAHFGLGAAETVDTLEVYWSDGKYQVLTEIPARQMVTVDYRNATAPSDLQEGNEAQPIRPDHLFREVPSAVTGLDYRHVEAEVVDFKQTPLLPHKYSQNGPGLAVGDVDGNGMDDLFVGADQGVESKLYLQRRIGRFEAEDLAGSAAFEDMGALFFDADGDGDLDLYVVSGGSAEPAGSGVYRDRFYMNDGSGALSESSGALPEIVTSGSTVTAADYDGDGDLDLFVGGRVIPGEYPLPPRSYLLRNDSQGPGRPRFTDVTTTLAPELAKIGLVTSALWTDFDGDHRVDLLVAGEWMPLTFLKNEGERFTDVTPSTGMGDTSGWWNSLAAGDFDNDGDTDYVAGNLGLNSWYETSPEEPVRVAAHDFDGTGSVDPMLSHYLQGESYPVPSRDALIQQISVMKGRFESYAAYAEAAFNQVLTRSELAQAYRREALIFETSYIENQGDGRFAIRPLPIKAQFAPTYGMLVGEYTGDAYLDVLMVGNSYAPNTQTGWYDASVGLLLAGDGHGDFDDIAYQTSGFFVDGDAKAIAEVRLSENRSLIITSQNNDSLAVADRNSNKDGRRYVRVDPGASYAILTLADGTKRKQEFYYGSTYLSQSSRSITVPSGATSVLVYDALGRKRALDVGVQNGDTLTDVALTEQR